MYEGFRYKVINQSYMGIDEYHWQPLAAGEYPNGIASNIKNEAPQAPASLTAHQTSEGLLISWTDALDAETPTKQMRYNVSVKRKGQTGEGAFLISPMNGLSDKATIGSNIQYRRATQMLIPASVLTEGETYEVQVQAIDLMGEHSPMTAPAEVTINSQGYIEVAEAQHSLLDATIVRYVGTAAQNFTLEATHAKEVKELGKGQYSITWAEAGLQTIKLTIDGHEYTTQVNVEQTPDMTLQFPDGIYLKTPLQVKVPEAVRNLKAVNLSFAEREGYSVQYVEGDSVATFVFHQSTDVDVEYSAVINGKRRYFTTAAWVYANTLEQPSIKFVTANGSNYMVFVEAPMNGIVKAVEVSRQNPLTKQYEVVGTANNGNGLIRFVDTTSENTLQAQSYRVRFVADNGVQKSELSATHTPLHLSVNQCTKGLNLIWNAYEGQKVGEYIIRRGTTPKNCQEIARVDGTTQSYIDTGATAADGYYYAVSFVTPEPAGMIRESWSNVVSSEQVFATQTIANTLALTTIEPTAELTDAQPSLHLMAVVLPTFTDISKISWRVVEGGGIAQLLPTGELVRVNSLVGGKGNIVVEAHTLDGSALTTQLSIPYNLSGMATGIGSATFSPLPNGNNSPVRYFDLTGRQVTHLVKGHIYITSQGKKVIAQ